MKLSKLYNKIKIIMSFLCIAFLFNIASACGKLINLVNCFSEVHLIVKGIWNKNILNDAFKFEPSEVIINGESKNCSKVCNFQKEENNVTLYFNDSINNSENMFYNLKDIKEIDLSKFDFSGVTTTKQMFLNISKINSFSRNFRNI